MLKSNLIKFTFYLFIIFPIIGGCQEKPEQSADTNQVVSGDKIKNVFADSIEVKTFYYDDDSKIQTQYQNGVRNGWTRNIDANGNITSEGTYVNNKMEGEFRAYYPDGKIFMKAFYKNGLLDGISYLYFLNGKVQKETKYERNKIIFIREYDKDGNLLYEDKF
jgi:antitoxin component YwqK of YwqJK toxin-antitoxin module